MNEFKNRESNKLNRKRYVIEEVKEDASGTIEEFIAYETRYDDDEEDAIVTEEGTKLDAESLTNIVSNISRNVTNQVLDEKEESLNEKINELSESKTNEILLEKESELTNKINELSEVKVFEVLNRIESDLTNKINELSEVKVFEVLNNLHSYLNSEVNKVTLLDEFITEYELPNNLDNNRIKATWTAVTTNVQIVNNKLTFERNINSFNATIKGIFTCGYIVIEREYEITIKGTLGSNVTTNLEKYLEFTQGMGNSYEVILETNDQSKLVFDMDQIINDNSDVLQYFNLFMTDIDDTKISVRITEKPYLSNSNKTGLEEFYFFIDFYIDNIRNVNKEQLYVAIVYHYASTEPED